ncbi:hypothetical protein ACFWMQ_03220 [Streptomyces sp. NPDC058372]|uniref:hypothetical protein n=1 Tax=Streptomyces sp. NPDC058372 TaxID=3346464 RepID=UPI003657BB75
MDTGRPGRTAVGRAFRAAVRTAVMDTGRTHGATVRGTFGTAVRTTVVHARRTGRTTVRGTFRTTVRTTVVHARRTGRTTVRGTFRTTVRTTVVHAGGTRRTTVRRAFRTAVRTAVMDSGRSGRTAVRGAFLLVRVLLGVGHRSSRASMRLGAGHLPGPGDGQRNPRAAPPESAYRHGAKVSIYGGKGQTRRHPAASLAAPGPSPAGTGMSRSLHQVS